MFKLCKWLWRKAQDDAKKDFLAELNSRAQYHMGRAEVAYYKDKARIDDKPKEMLSDGGLSPKEHQAVANALRNLEIDILASAPPQEPGMTKFDCPVCGAKDQNHRAHICKSQETQE